MLRPLIANFDKVIFTKYQDNPRGKSAKELLKLAKSIRAELRQSNVDIQSEFVTEPTPKQAWEHYQKYATDDQLVCLTGSAFLVAELRKTVLESVR